MIRYRTDVHEITTFMRVSNKMPAQCGRIYTLRLASLALSFRLVRLFITKGKAERRGVFRPKGLFAFSLLLAHLFRGGSTQVV